MCQHWLSFNSNVSSGEFKQLAHTSPPDRTPFLGAPGLVRIRAADQATALKARKRAACDYRHRHTCRSGATDQAAAT